MKRAAGLLISLVILMQACYRKEIKLADTRFMFDTVCEIIIYADKKVAGPIMDAAFERMSDIEKKFDIRVPASPVYIFNASGNPIEDEEISNLVNLSLKIADSSGGAFDPTLLPLSSLWDFSSAAPSVPERAAIEAALKKTGYMKVAVDGRVVRPLSEGVQLDFGGIAKGYAVDEALKIIRASGAAAALVNLGGDLSAYGRREWKIGIRDPYRKSLAGVMRITNKAVVTSGDYERFFEKDGVYYHHIIDPASGMPARGIKSVTIISDSAARADGWATAVFVMGAAAGMKRIESMKDIDAVMILTDGDRISSSGIQDHVDWLE